MDALTIDKSNIRDIGRSAETRKGCGFCKAQFDAFCSKECRNITFEEFWNPPYRPEWCPGQEYSDTCTI